MMHPFTCNNHKQNENPRYCLIRGWHIVEEKKTAPLTQPKCIVNEATMIAEIPI